MIALLMLVSPAQFDYSKHNERIRQEMEAEGLDVQMGYDGLAFDLAL